MAAWLQFIHRPSAGYMFELNCNGRGDDEGKGGASQDIGQNLYRSWIQAQELRQQEQKI
ncbi:GM13830 [Drosophila sechellia]|uniref:GM13830 n=1 Tax=Drosophila sechellia TaxID=7238 RepID=B4HUW4_DROSE|nr:GM13830 [Drosophila sechellia]